MFMPLLLLATFAAEAGAPAWSSVLSASWSHHTTRDHKDAGEVQVFKATVSGVACFQGVASTDVEGDTLLKVATDIVGTKRWSSAGVAEAEVLGRSGSRIDYYQLLDVPGWTMASDRFWLLRGVVEKSAGVSIFRWDRILDGAGYEERYGKIREAHPKAIEPPVNVGGWVFTDHDDGVRIQYYVCTDTGGAIPSSVQNAATTRTLPDTVGDLVREGRRRTK